MDLTINIIALVVSSRRFGH